jgi:hypothetical protein
MGVADYADLPKEHNSHNDVPVVASGSEQRAALSTLYDNLLFVAAGQADALGSRLPVGCAAVRPAPASLLRSARRGQGRRGSPRAGGL